MRISVINRPSLCITQIPGEYRINCISLLILSILQYSGFYIVKLYQELVLGEEIVAEARPLGSMEPSPPLAMLQRQQHPLMKCQSRLLGDPKCIQSTMCGP